MTELIAVRPSSGWTTSGKYHAVQADATKSLCGVELGSALTGRRHPVLFSEYNDTYKQCKRCRTIADKAAINPTFGPEWTTYTEDEDGTEHTACCDAWTKGSSALGYSQIVCRACYRTVIL